MQQETEEGFLKAFDDYSDAIYRHIFFRVFNKELALDLTQDTFMKTWEYLEKGRKVENLRAFLYQVATNLVIDYSRKKKEVSLDALHDAGFDPGFQEAEKISKNIDFSLVLQVLQKLDENDREIVSMRFVDDLSPEEIARILGVSDNVVNVRVHRALKKLKDL